VRSAKRAAKANLKSKMDVDDDAELATVDKAMAEARRSMENKRRKLEASEIRPMDDAMRQEITEKAQLLAKARGLLQCDVSEPSSGEASAESAGSDAEVDGGARAAQSQTSRSQSPSSKSHSSSASSQGRRPAAAKSQGSAAATAGSDNRELLQAIAFKERSQVEDWGGANSRGQNLVALCCEDSKSR
jgi:hypothetical protein